MTRLAALRRSGITCCIAVLLAGLPCFSADEARGQPAAPASQVDAVQAAQQMISGGQHAGALRYIDQQLVQRHIDQQGDERYQLLMLKGRR
jgi:hypothetical protein